MLISLQSDLKRLWRQWWPCCRCCCLGGSVGGDSTIMVREYSKYDHNTRCCDRRDSSSGGSNTMKTSVDSSKKLLNVRINGVGRYETELGSSNNSMLKPPKLYKPPTRKRWSCVPRDVCEWCVHSKLIVSELKWIPFWRRQFLVQFCDRKK